MHSFPLFYATSRFGRQAQACIVFCGLKTFSMKYVEL